jgi:L,D-peptidoglycan transpeptidase YkuD (ErfK/YbiS/YcfS/YnhG family)
MAGSHVIPVALGRGGIKSNKFEGDGATPRGVFHPVKLWWRADRHVRPRTLLPVRVIQPRDAWSENDFIIEIDHNTRPRIARRGSAVFLHLARDNFSATAGCVGMTKSAMLRLLSRIGPSTRIVIE